MAMLDVSDVLVDPMFCEELFITRREQTVGDDGLATVKEIQFNAIGVVAPSGIPYAISPDSEAGRNMITVHCSVRLFGPAKGRQPDLLTWQGNDYVVRKSANWSQFGAGFFSAECELLDTELAR